MSDARRNYYENAHLTDPAEIREKIEFAHSCATVMEKYVIQVTQYADKPTHGVAQMRPELQFEEFQPGVGDWNGPSGGCCGGNVNNDIEKIKRIRRSPKN